MVEAVFEYTRVLPIYDQLVENLANAAAVLEKAQGIYITVRRRRGSQSSELVEIKKILVATSVDSVSRQQANEQRCIRPYT